MISASADLVTAITSPESEPMIKVVADWGLNGLGAGSTLPGRTLFVRDTFTRVAASAWGQPDVGPPWSTDGGSASDFAVDGDEGTHSLGSLNVSRRTYTGELADVDVTVKVIVPVLATGADLKASVVARWQDLNNHYIAWLQFNPGATMYLEVAKVVAGAVTSLVVDTTTGLTHVAASQYAIRLQVYGTAIRAKAWEVDAGEPDAWNIETTDSGLTAPGGAGCRSIASTGNTNSLPVVVRYDDFVAVNLQGIRDLSDRIQSLTIDRSLTADSPDEVRVVEGSAAAQLDVVLAAGDDTDEARAAAAWWFSPYNAQSPLFGFQRHNVPVYAEIGARTPAGVETLRRFTGRTIARPVSARSGAVELAALDGRDRVRRPVELPMVVADASFLIQPGLNAQWVIDYILRANGIYASPATRDRCLMSATMHGSAAPEVGALIAITSYYDFDEDVDMPCRFVDGHFALAFDAADGIDLHLATYRPDATYATGPNNGQVVFGEGWVFVTPGAASSSIWNIRSDSGGTAAYVRMALVDTGASSQVRMDFVRVPGGAAVNVNGPTISGDPGWHYVAVHVTFGATVTTRFRVDGAAVSEVNTVDASVFESPTFVEVDVSGQTKVEALQVTSEPYSATMWNDAFVPTAVLDASINELTAIPPGASGDSWDLLAEITAAEYASFGFDEQGVFRWRNRARWVQTDAQTQQTQLTAVSHVLDLDIDDGIAAVRNIVTVPASPIAVSELIEVWATAEVLVIPPLGSLTIWANFSDAVSDIVVSDPIFLGEMSLFGWYEVNSKADGTGSAAGTGVTLSYEAVFATSAKIRAVNTNTTARYLVNTSGEPSFHLIGRTVTQADTVSPVAEDAGSVAKYDARPLPVPANRWRQSQSAALGLAGDLLGELKIPRPTIRGLRVVGDPRLQLGDRAGVEVLDAVGLDDDYWITACRDEFDRDGGYTQVLAVRQATTVLLWDVGRWDVNVWGE